MSDSEISEFSDDEKVDVMEHDFWYQFRSNIGYSAKRPMIEFKTAQTTFNLRLVPPIRFTPCGLGESEFDIEFAHSDVYSRTELVNQLMKWEEILIPPDIFELFFKNTDVNIRVHAAWTRRA